MVYHAPRTTGLAISFGGLLLLLGVDAVLLILLRANPLSAPGFLGLVLAAASVPVEVMLAYRAYALLRSRYVLSRNAVVISWGGRRIVLPLGLLDEARAGADVETDLRPRGLTWPGYHAGRAANVPGLGSVEFLATAEKSGLVLLRHADAWLAISPPDPAAFLAELERLRAEGPEEAVAPESVLPAFERWDLWQDRLALSLIGLGGLSAILLLGYLAFISPQLPPQLALHFDAQGRPDRFGPPSGLLILPAIAWLAWVANTVLGAWLHRQAEERPAAYLLLGATLLVQALVWGATVGLLTAGSNA